MGTSRGPTPAQLRRLWAAGHRPAVGRLRLAAAFGLAWALVRASRGPSVRGVFSAWLERAGASLREQGAAVRIEASGAYVTALAQQVFPVALGLAVVLLGVPWLVGRGVWASVDPRSRRGQGRRVGPGEGAVAATGGGPALVVAAGVLAFACLALGARGLVAASARAVDASAAALGDLARAWVEHGLLLGAGLLGAVGLAELWIGRARLGRRAAQLRDRPEPGARPRIRAR